MKDSMLRVLINRLESCIEDAEELFTENILSRNEVIEFQDNLIKSQKMLEDTLEDIRPQKTTVELQKETFNKSLTSWFEFKLNEFSQTDNGVKFFITHKDDSFKISLLKDNEEIEVLRHNFNSPYDKTLQELKLFFVGFSVSNLPKELSIKDANKVMDFIKKFLK